MKFYVRSNQLQTVVGGPHIESAKDAACEAFLSYYKEDMVLSPLTIVSERGWDYVEHEDCEDVVLITSDVLKAAGFTFGDDS